MAVDVLVREGVEVAVLLAVCDGVAVAVAVSVAVGLWVADALGDGEDVGVGVADFVAVGGGVRDDVAEAVAVAGARSTRAKSPKLDVYPHSVPCSSSRLSNVRFPSRDQVDPLLFSRTSWCGSAYGAVSKTTQRILLPD